MIRKIRNLKGAYKIREFLEEKLKNIGDNIAASSVDDEDVGATTSSKKKKPATGKPTEQVILQIDDKLELGSKPDLRDSPRLS
ncbi:hypothetical protein EJB10_02805 [Wolbachia endosymbiont of Brugia malayi]|uniref:hypothetical protein n=1 Tax=Wolbachia endosymbiont of Brugia malayi TaxID=80849 RepID=UPI00004C9296|nr:hypothetical protein [Wolbachia endosymbiont of Brugia malayi]AAW70725.1 Predicted protein [Wolbachia endosymbiont strain TRS of Brugia malayi]QCB61702.1 hypothetical protein EJB10_02805 [Wolbachia endosymbiont of Brugia malayi]